MKAGRYFFEVSMLEFLNPPTSAGSGRGPVPRQLVRVGFSTAASPLVLNDGDAGAFFFDAEGFYSSAETKRVQVGKRFARDEVIGVLLNLDAGSPNANTISVFRNGERASEPQRLPEQLKGETLFPHVSFRNVTLEINFGPEPIKPWPFVCSALQGAAQDDVVVKKYPAPKDGKHTVVFPVGWPDEGTFAWLEHFLEKNPDFVELSDRSIIDWAVKSGLWRNKTHAWKSSKDKPDYNFGVPLMDDFSVRRVLNSIAPTVPRNYVVMEVKQNLVAVDRKENLNRFPNASFKKVARVALGDPTEEFQKVARRALLKEKVAKAEFEWKAKKIERERKKMVAKRKHELAAKQRQARQQNGEEVLDEQAEEPEDAEDEEMEMPEVSLTEEEEKHWFVPPAPGSQDLTQQAFERSFSGFSIPEKKEGFDEVLFEWANEKTSREYLKTKVLEKKRTAKIESLVPGEWFKTQQAEWGKQVKAWQAKQAEAKVAAKRAGGEVDDDAKLDVFSVEDVCDLGNGEPLFLKFEKEDWLLLSLRWELSTLVHAFKKDAGDEDNASLPEVHLAFYYCKYFKKQLVPKLYGQQTVPEVVSMVADTVSMTNDFLVPLNAPGSFDVFMKLAEEGRRERQRRISAGDEGARVKVA
eukprot:TRINITY_DN48438_c0_g1_i1.p1 TRINITY_DN48438_c0_g1~~TRINITY_DN48438_c0_g1_i1.p1  ORF type:complete len:747 (+),score=169.75 TRINITY_DN48438_c0_g1_i1:333-2243(+)